MRDFWRTLWMQQAGLIDASLSSFYEKSTVALSFGRIRTRLGVNNSQVFRLTLDFFPHKFATCSKPLSRDNHRKASYPRTQQHDQGAGWTHVHATRVIVKTTSLPSWPRCRQPNKGTFRGVFSFLHVNLTMAVNEYLSKYFMNWFLEYSNKKLAQLIFHYFLR